MSSTLTAPVTDRPLRLSLRVDALACAVSVPVLVFGAGLLSAPLGLPGPLLFAAGLFLLPLAVCLWLAAAAATVRPWAVSAVLAVNTLWVLGSVAVVVLFSPAPWGVAFVLVQAAAVAAITVAEALTLRRAGGERTTRGTV